MTHDVFARELIQRTENVRQKERRLWLAEQNLAVWGSTRERELAYAEARNNLRAADEEYAEFLHKSLVAAGAARV